MKLKHIIYVMLLIFTLVPLYVFGVFMIYENDRKVEEIVRENLAAVSGTQMLDITNFCEAQKEKLEILANLDMVHDVICYNLEGRTLQGSEYLTNMLIERKKYNEYIESISIIDRNFQVVASSNYYPRNGMSDLRYAQEKYLTGEFCFSGVVERQINGKAKKVVIAYQGIFEGPELLGYVVEEVDLAYFDKNRSATNLWQGGTLYLMDGSDRMITAGTSDEKRSEYVTSQEEREDFVRAWNAVDFEKNPTGEIDYEVNGEEYITYYSLVPYTDWNMKISVSLTKCLESRKAYKVLFGITIALVSLLVVMVNYFISKRMTRPLENIEGTLKRVQDNQDYTLRIENCRRDEIGALAVKVNALLDYIEQEKIQEKEQQRYLKRKAERDPLTGVRNKKAIEEGLQDMVQRAQESGQRIAVAFVDIDDFKNFNTKYGHQVGDQVLQFVASVLQEYSGGIVGRNGGDEFIFGLEQFQDTAEVEERTRKIIRALGEGIRRREGGSRLAVSCSVGIVIARGKPLSYGSLVRAADEAMYAAKQEGKNTYKIIVKNSDGLI